MSRLHQLIASFAGVVLFVGCTPPSNSSSDQTPEPKKDSLSRSEAKTKIEASPDLHALERTIPMYPDAFLQGPRQGLWDSNGRLTTKGQRNFSSTDGLKFSLKAPTSITTVITGITDVPLAQNLKEVQFDWTYSEMPSVARRFAVLGGNGLAHFQLFDDGWRLREVTFQHSTVPFVMSPGERQEAAQDEAEEAERQRAAARHQEDERARLAALAAASKVRSGKLTSFFCDNWYSRSEQKLPNKISDVDIEAIDAGGPERWRTTTIWFGDVSGLALENFGKPGFYIYNKQGMVHLAFSNQQERDKAFKLVEDALAAWRQKYAELVPSK
ncbi:MAG TPA: hypothetical protein VGO11_27460 [Chthoniobacteraceae bacterium]|jgi:hypothetical protein|nr:hypothetical protein [Chthoniobacteraceae bacterium]